MVENEWIRQKPGDITWLNGCLTFDLHEHMLFFRKQD